MTIQELQLPVLDAFNRFKSEYSHCIKGGNEGRYPSIIAEVEEHLSSHPGKMLRPLLLLLSAKVCEHLSDMHIKLAVAMELLHNATLMHDDVVDESDKRRGTDSVRHLWGNQAAVLCGDYFLSRVMSILQETGNKQASIIVAKTVATMSLGELKQLKYVGRKDISTDQYLDVIGSKTASLLSVCCELGSLLETGDYAPFCNAMRDFGYHYGIVFQIRDDMADMQEAHDIKMPDTVQPEDLVAHHARIASEALLQIPDSQAKQSLLCLLQKIQCN